MTLSHNKLWALGGYVWDIIYLSISNAWCLASSGLSINVFEFNWNVELNSKLLSQILRKKACHQALPICVHSPFLKCSNNSFPTWCSLPPAHPQNSTNYINKIRKQLAGNPCFLSQLLSVFLPHHRKRWPNKKFLSSLDVLTTSKTKISLSIVNHVTKPIFLKTLLG